MAVYRYCLTSQGLQRNTLLHAVALPLAFSPSPPLTDHQHSQTVTQTTTSPTERHLPRHTSRICTPKVHRPPRPQSPLPTTSRRNITRRNSIPPSTLSPPTSTTNRAKTKQPHVPGIGIAWLRMCLSGGSRECVMRLKPHGRDLRLGLRKRGGGAATP